MIPSYLFLFGLAGVGKTYCGERLARQLGYRFYDLDSDMTAAMRSAIAEARPFTDEIRDEYFDVVIRRIGEIKASVPRCIFTQGAYKQKHRERVRVAHPDVAFVMIDAPMSVIVERLQRRGSPVDPAYAAMLQKSFEPAPPGAPVLLNDCASEAELVRRLSGVFAAQSL